MDSSNLDADRASTPVPAERLTVVEEVLDIGKRVVDAGRGLRLRKIVRDDVVQVMESLATDEFTVERVAVDRVVDATPAVRHEGDTMIVPVVAERVVTRIELVLVEELHVTRTERHVPFVQDVTLRREELVVERFDETSGDKNPIGR